MSGDRRHWWSRRDRPGAVPAGSAPPTAASAPPITGLPVPGPPVGSPRLPPPADPPPVDPREVEAAVLARLHDYVYVQVRSGVFDPQQLRGITVEAATAEVHEPGYADLLARRVLSAELTDWYAEAATWSGRTDPDRLDAALARLAANGVLVLPALSSPAQISEARHVRGSAAGCVAYLVGDIWNALDHAELPLTVLDGQGQRVGRGSSLLVAVMDALAAEGLLAHALGSPPRVVVPLHWRRRPPADGSDAPADGPDASADEPAPADPPVADVRADRPAES